MAFTDGKPLARALSVAALVMGVVLTVIGVASGQWFATVPLALMAVMLLLARSPLFRFAISHELDAIACRYVPWYEPAPYVGVGFSLILGLWSVAAALQPGSSPVFGVLGAAMLVLVPIVAAKFLRGYRRCSLRVTATALSLPDPARGYAMVTIPRERVLSVAPVTQTIGFGSTELVLSQITFRDTDGVVRTVCVGPAPAEDTVWLTVRPASLLTALQDWVRADPGDPGFLDRIDAQLRSREGTTDPRRLATLPAVGPAAGQGVAPAAPGTPVQPAGSLAAPSRARRWFSSGPLSLLLVVSALGAGYPLYRHAHRDPIPERSVSSALPTAERPVCPVAGASVVALPKKSDAEPTIELPLAPGWVTRDINDPQLADEDSLRGYANNPAISEDGYPFLKVTLQTTPDSGRSIADALIAKARKMFPTVTQSSATVCEQSLYRFDTAGYNPDGNGAQSGTTVFSVLDGTDGSRWLASAFLKTQNPDNPAYIAQRDALVAGFHVDLR